MTTHSAALSLPTPAAPFASLLPVLTLEQASDQAAALALNMHIPTHVTLQRGLYRVWDDGDITAGYADKDDIVTTVDPEDVYPIVCEEETEMTDPRLPWSLYQEAETGGYSILDVNGVPLAMSSTHNDRDLFVMIIQAVNCHENLVAALEALVTTHVNPIGEEYWSGGDSVFSRGGRSRTRIRESEEMAHEAIAKARA